MILKFLNEPEANKNLKTSKERKGEPALILWMPNPGFIPKPFDVSEFRSPKVNLKCRWHEVAESEYSQN